MIQIAISDEVASTLASAAASRSCSLEELASMLIDEGLRREEEFKLTRDQENRILHSVAQPERGEFVDGGDVMAKFDQVLEKIRAR